MKDKQNECLPESSRVKLEYNGRLFGDVLRDIVYQTAKNTYIFADLTGFNNVVLSNFINHQRYPGIVTLRRVATVLPEEQRDDFIIHFKNPATRAWSVKTLKDRGIEKPYIYYSRCYKNGSLTNMFQEVSQETLASLELQGLFKYLTEAEKTTFKNNIIAYIVERNKSINKHLL